MYQVFELGRVFSEALDGKRDPHPPVNPSNSRSGGEREAPSDVTPFLQLIFENLIHWEPPVKVVKLHGSLNTRNMVWDAHTAVRVASALFGIKGTERILSGIVVPGIQTRQ